MRGNHLSMTLLNEKYLSQLSTLRGRCAFRGQANSTWKLHAAATRRLIQHWDGDESIIHTPGFPRLYATYHHEVLIEPSRTNGFDIAQGHRISDLQLLAKLQHFGAATGLLDFTWNPLIALWFACATAARDSNACDGKVFVVDLNDPIKFQRVGSDEGQQRVTAIFSSEATAKKTRYWEPRIQGEAAQRVLRQRSVFVIGCPVVPEDAIVTSLDVTASEKEQLVQELEAHFDLSNRSLFMDIHGFSVANGAVADVPQMDDPNYYLFNGNRFAQQGDWLHAIASYNRCIDLAPDIGETYFLRGNAKAERREYSEALRDYDAAIHHKDKPLHNMNPDLVVLFAPYLWMVYFNSGNVKAELDDAAGSVSDYTAAIQTFNAHYQNSQPPVLFFNRANALAMLDRFEEAIDDYDQAIRLGYRVAHFNKGNTLVRLGNFGDALPCYDASLREETSLTGTSQNRNAVQEILALIDGTAYDFGQQEDVAGQRVLEVAVQAARRNRQDQHFIFCGNSGNTGNLGFRVPGGKGFGGKHGFRVCVTYRER